MRKGLYEQVIDVADDYLGPASKRFVDRQIVNHLDKQPEELVGEDMDPLIDWIKLALAFLTEDKSMIEEFAHRLSLLDNHSKVS